MKIALCAFLACAFFADAANGQEGEISHAATTASSFTGHYELVKSTKIAFSFDVLQKGKNATISFSGGHVDGSGAAPDGDGEGGLNSKGDLEFKWTDTFDNAGTGTLRRNGKLYHLTLNASKVAEPRALVFYGEIQLKRTSTKPQMSTR